MSAPNTYVLINVSQEGVLDLFLLFIEKTKRALFIYTIMHTHHTMLYFLCEHAPSSLPPPQRHTCQSQSVGSRF